jgi:hypothetical protein
MPALIVPTPVLEPLLRSQPPKASDYAVEMPLVARAGAPVRPDGTVLGVAELGRHGARLCRRTSAAGGVDVWDAAQKRWFAEVSAAGQNAAPVLLALTGDPARPWVAVLANAPDANGDPILGKDDGSGHPLYFVRSVFADRADERVGTSAGSAAVVLGSILPQLRVEVRLNPASPTTAESVRLLLKDPAGGEVGSLLISGRTADPAEVMVSSRGGAAVKLKANGDVEIVAGANGDVEIVPGAGGAVVVREPFRGVRSNGTVVNFL